MITAMTLTNGTLTVIIDNGSQILTARNDHPRWSEILEAYKNGNKQRLEVLVSLQAVVEEYSVGSLSVNATGVTYRGQPMHTVDSDRVMAFLREGLPYRPLANYMANKMANPSARAITEMYTFLEHKGMPIDDDGYIIAYKGVCNDFFSVYGNLQTVVIQGEVDAAGRLLNKVGATIEVERSSVDDNFLMGCSFGLHAGSIAYASGHGNRVILVRINPADVVSVPSDCNCQKLRCCKYTVIGEFTGKLPNTYTNEYAKTDVVPRVDDSCDNDDDGTEDADEYASHTNDGRCDCDDCENDRNVLAESNEISNEVDKEDTGKVKIGFGLDVANSSYISDRLKEIISEQFGVPVYKITDSSTPYELNLDSLDQVELEMAIEEEFGVLFDFDKDYNIDNFEGLVKLVRSMITVHDVVASSAKVEDDSYLKGMNDGVSDCAKGIPARFLAGDQADVETAAYAKYIDGYLAGHL